MFFGCFRCNEKQFVGNVETDRRAFSCVRRKFVSVTSSLNQREVKLQASAIVTSCSPVGVVFILKRQFWRSALRPPKRRTQLKMWLSEQVLHFSKTLITSLGPLMSPGGKYVVVISRLRPLCMQL